MNLLIEKTTAALVECVDALQKSDVIQFTQVELQKIAALTEVLRVALALL